MCYLWLNLLKLLTMIIKVDDLPFFFLHKKQVVLRLPTSPLKNKIRNEKWPPLSLIFAMGLAKRVYLPIYYVISNSIYQT